MRRATRRCLGLALWASLVLAVVLGLWLGGSCAMMKKYRPPLVVQVGPTWVPPARDNQDMLLVGRVVMPTRPVGAWIESRYDFGNQEVDSLGGGLIFYFPGGTAFEPNPEPETEAVEELPGP